jgi:transposase
VIYQSSAGCGFMQSLATIWDRLGTQRATALCDMQCAAARLPSGRLRYQRAAAIMPVRVAARRNRCIISCRGTSLFPGSIPYARMRGRAVRTDQQGTLLSWKTSRKERQPGGSAGDACRALQVRTAARCEVSSRTAWLFRTGNCFRTLGQQQRARGLIWGRDRSNALRCAQ